MRVIVRRERPRPGAQLRFDDVEGRVAGSLGAKVTRRFNLYRWAGEEATKDV
jgi:hypothetical protein